MASILLVIVYIVFISLGLPDGILGSAWPEMYPALHVPVGVGGIIALISTLLSLCSSLSAAYFQKKIGVGPLITISVGLTALGLLGNAFSPTIYWLFAFAIPLGFGAGAIDVALNHYVATHFKAHHMNWLHAFWGLGAASGPFIFALTLTYTSDWHLGFLPIAFIQLGVLVLLICTLPLWRKVHTIKHSNVQEETPASDIKFIQLLKDKVVILAFSSFFLYVGVEVAIGLWVASYLAAVQQVPAHTAAMATGMYFAAITIGRILSGFFSMKSSTKALVRYGLVLALVGIAVLVLSSSVSGAFIGVACIGLGFAPIFPGLMHQTPERFGKARAARITGLQITGGTLGATTIPPLIGLLVSIFSFHAFAVAISIIAVLLFIATEWTDSSSRNIRL